ncbi:hypothetical protein RF638_15490 [Kocuria sp. CPCC 205235]|uniref:DUF6414 family protein n=1 Tax=Kocuria sp. CPCC 205235 TaxID=3073549 RepID=UPI0034D62965
MLREFLYLDTLLVDNYLAQVEDGLYDETQQREMGAVGGEGNLSMNMGVVQGGLGGNGSSEKEAARTYRQTPESRFNRLYEKLQARSVEDFTKNLWGDLKRGEVLDVECELEIPSMARLMVQGEQLSDFASLVRTFSPDAISAQDEEALTGFQALSSRGGNNRFIATGELGTEAPVFAFKLSKESLRTDMDSLEGEVNVVGKMERKWPEGESHSLLDIPGLSLMSRKDRRAAARQKGPNQSAPEGMELDGPGVSMSVIAIYR